MGALATAGAVRVAAPAKVNLYLHVLGRRADGYHLLDSLIAFATLHDIVAASDANRLALEVTGPFAAGLDRQADNLVLRAARALAETAGIVPRACIRLDKRLPVAAGIGGGSADAAAALRALVALWRLAVPEDELQRLAMALGADVPACLAGRATFVGGVGERLQPAPDLPPAGLVLVNPGVAVATANVFARPEIRYGSPGRFDDAPADASSLAVLLSTRRNDLAASAVAVVPQIEAVLAALGTSPGCLLARMSGSGATCFGLYSDETVAAGTATALAADHPGWWVAASRLVSDASDVVPAD